MLTDDQIQQLWERKISAEVRSLYFAEMASRYSRRKHVITFVTFFLASGAASSILAKADPWIPLVLSVAVCFAQRVFGGVRVGEVSPDSREAPLFVASTRG